MVGFITFVGLAYGLFKYEWTKYKLFTRYNVLVNKYLDACETVYMSELRK